VGDQRPRDLLMEVDDCATVSLEFHRRATLPELFALA